MVLLLYVPVLKSGVVVCCVKAKDLEEEEDVNKKLSCCMFLLVLKSGVSGLLGGVLTGVIAVLILVKTGNLDLGYGLADLQQELDYDKSEIF